ncbi:MAG: lysoplasmalogenase family protein, partial [Candidatus Rokuibacteriota bacterium]
MDALTFGRLRGFGRLDQALLLLSIASSVAYMATRGLHPFQGSVVLKALGMAPLAVLAFRVLGRVGSRDRSVLTAALALSCVGDVFLALGFRRYFVHGLAAFLLAHVAYIVLFTRNWA